MPRITAANIKEHNHNILTALIDAAEQLLRDDPEQTLTAGAVATNAGIARNSIYKHVTSVDELRTLVIRRHIPPWAQALHDALQTVEDPQERIRTWARTNLEQSSSTGHGWLVRLAFHAGATGTSPAGQVNDAPHHSDDEVEGIHQEFDQQLRIDFLRIVPADLAPTYLEIIRGIVDAGMRRIDLADPLEPTTHIVDDAIVGLLRPHTRPSTC